MCSPTRVLPLLSLLAIIGGASCSLQLKPDLTEVERYMNGTFIVSCQGPGASDIKWKSPTGQTIQKEGRVHVEARAEGSEESVALVFESIARSDRGNYSCSATIDNNTVKKSFTLTVVTAISFQGTPLEQNATEGHNYLLRCQVSGDPPPTVTWHFKGQLLTDDRYVTMPAGLRISNVSHEDAGKYQCRGYQISALTSGLKEETIMLNVLHKPHWQERSEASEVAYGFAGGSANLSCLASAYPEPEYVWTWNNATLENELNGTYTILQEDQGSYLQFPVENSSYFGEYECTARNSLGEIKKTIELRRGLKPDKPAAVSVLVANRTTAKLNITLGQTADSDEEDDDHRLPVTGFRIEFLSAGADQFYSWDDSHYQEVTVEPKDGSTYTLVGLSEDTDYLCRVAARNPAGLGHFSEELRFRTSGPPSSESPTSTSPPVRRQGLALFVICFLFFL